MENNFELPTHLWTKRNNLKYVGEIEEASGWKVARLTSLSPLTFSGLNFGKYTISQVAECNFDKTHSAPYALCDCGFYSFYDRSKALYVSGYGRGYFLLKVENYGRIIQHQYGQRSGEQDIISVHYSNRCSKLFCKGKVTHLSRGRRFYLSRCDRHLLQDSVKVSKLTSLTGVEFSPYNI